MKILLCAVLVVAVTCQSYGYNSASAPNPPPAPPVTPPVTLQTPPAPPAAPQECPVFSFDHQISTSDDRMFRVQFKPLRNVPIAWVDIHYKVNGGELFNIRMTRSSAEPNIFEVAGIELKPGDNLQMFFTYCANNVDCDTQWLSFSLPAPTQPLQQPYQQPAPAPAPLQQPYQQQQPQQPLQQPYQQPAPAPAPLQQPYQQQPTQPLQQPYQQQPTQPLQQPYGNGGGRIAPLMNGNGNKVMASSSTTLVPGVGALQSDSFGTVRLPLATASSVPGRVPVLQASVLPLNTAQIGGSPLSAGAGFGGPMGLSAGAGFVGSPLSAGAGYGAPVAPLSAGAGFGGSPLSAGAGYGAPVAPLSAGAGYGAPLAAGVGYGGPGFAAAPLATGFVKSHAFSHSHGPVFAPVAAAPGGY